MTATLSGWQGFIAVTLTPSSLHPHALTGGLIVM